MSSDYVDLGLPSGLLWAKKNLGAATEEDAGLYFQWGDTVGYTITVNDNENADWSKKFYWTDYKFSADGTSQNLLKYNSDDNKTVLDLEDDAVHVMMGGNWRMPTREDFYELILNTDIYILLENNKELKIPVITYSSEIYFDYNSVSGLIDSNLKAIKFYKKNNNIIYICVPLSGYVREQYLDSFGNNALLWTSSLCDDTITSWSFSFGSDGFIEYRRFYGIPLRGVLSK